MAMKPLIFKKGNVYYMGIRTRDVKALPVKNQSIVLYQFRLPASNLSHLTFLKINFGFYMLSIVLRFFIQFIQMSVYYVD